VERLVGVSVRGSLIVVEDAVPILDDIPVLPDPDEVLDEVVDGNLGVRIVIGKVREVGGTKGGVGRSSLKIQPATRSRAGRNSAANRLITVNPPSRAS
jgi:hypothetical protein